MSYRTIRLSVESGVATLRLHRPERMNAVVEEMYREIGEALARCEEDRGLRVLVLTGSELRRGGEVKQAFCAGADLKEHASGRRGPEARRDYIRLAHETCRRLHEHPLPTLAAVNGPARGAGAELALCCDFLFMAEEATLAFPETGLGTFVGGGTTYHLPRLVGTARAKELIYTGRVLDGRQAAVLGLALRSVPLERLGEESAAFAAALAARAPLSLRLAKRQLQAPGARDLETALAEEAEGILACMETRDWREGVLAFSEDRPPVFQGE